MTDDRPVDGVRRSSGELCPSWCTREHLPDQHVEDRRHHDEGQVIAVVLGRVDTSDMTIKPVATEVVVRRERVFGDPTTWVVITESETSLQLLVSLETLPWLLTALLAGSG